MNQGGSNNLKKNYSTWAIFSIINNTKLDDKPIVGWRIISGKKVTVELFIRVIRKFRNEVVIRATRPDGRKTLSNLVAGSDKLNLYLPDDLVLFQSNIKSCDENGDITISVPEMIAQIDRRKHLRLFVENDIDVKVNFNKEIQGQRILNQNFNKKCFDVSAGGLSFLISKIESKFFENGDKVSGITLNVGERKTKISGNVVNILDIEPDEQNGLHYKCKKICIRYENVTLQQKKVINDYVFKYIDISEAI
jgi:hypothetical protein